MAATSGVWGLDIGHCALKALRCEYDDANQVLVATAFDYIEHPKILSQPDANPKELIQEAISQFLQRNNVRGDRIVISVPGQSGLVRFFEPPPVDLKKLADIVRFEARQAIPFPLEEVIWDYQLMGGANEVDGFLMEAEVGLVAMKRDQVYEALEPYRQADLEINIVQLGPICTYNFVAHSLMTDALAADIYDADNPPESFVIISMGTDTTDLVVTNGFRIWQRNMPIGGNHFTKQLTKELKLTFAKAEHLKRNVREAEDAKAVIQAMRPVFNDLLTEVQRSVGFFQNIERKAQIGGLIMLGNAVKLPGLQQYLAKNLGYELVNVDHERWSAKLAGQSVLSSPQFKDNMHAFAVCYGLCLQGLGQAKFDTNLLPKEMLTERIIRAKKPWALATASGLMLAFAVNFFFEYNAWYKVHPQRVQDGVTWEAAMKEVDTVSTQFSTNEQQDSTRVKRLDELVALGKELSGNSDRRVLWMELLKTINEALPKDEAVAGQVPDPKEIPISQRKDIHIEYIESQYLPDLKSWFTEPIQKKYQEELARLQGTPIPAAAPGAAPTGVPAAGAAAGPAAAADAGNPAAAAPAAPAAGGGVAPAAGIPAAPAAGTPAGPASPAAIPAATDSGTAGAADGSGDSQAVAGPDGPGWVIEIKGHHFYNEDITTWGGTHVRDTFLKNLREQTVELPTGPGLPPTRFTMAELGIGFVVLTVDPPIDQANRIPNPYYEPTLQAPGSGVPGMPGMMDASGGMMPAMAPAMPAAPGAGPPGSGAKTEKKEKEEPKEPPFFAAPKYTFVLQFCWQERLLTERLRKRQQEQMPQPADQPQPEQPQPGQPQPAVPDNKVAAATTGG
jgi:type IV pilus assembly protein PilM